MLEPVRATSAAPADAGSPWACEVMVSMPTRSLGLDALRATAAFMVFVYHANLVFGVTVPFAPLSEHGSTGVLVFFVLSGYVLYRPFVAGRVDSVRYARNRFARIYPAYVAALIGAALLGGQAITPDYWLFLQQPDLRDPHALLPVSWTLQVEVVFYLVLPLVALLFRPVRRRALWLALLCVALVLGSLVLGLAVVVPPRTGPLVFLYMAWAFVPGMIVAELAPVGQRWAIVPGLILVILGLVTAMVPFWDFVTVIGAAFLVYGLSDAGAPATLARSGSRLSYAFYLWQLPLLAAVAALGLAGWIGAFVSLALVVAVSALSWTFVEAPAMRLAHRFERPLPGRGHWLGGR